MYTPQKFYEEILVSNPYLKVSEKKVVFWLLDIIVIKQFELASYQ